MPGKIQENLNSLGVVVSIFFSFFGFYNEYIRTSEEVEASSLSFLGNSDSNGKIDSATVNILLLNKGNNPVTLADISFRMTSSDHKGRIQMEAVE